MTLRLLQSLPTMSLAISIVVVICMAISFASLFFLYGRTKAKGVNFGVEDNSLKTELSNRLKKCENGTTYTQMIADSKKREKIIQIITDAVLFVLIVFVGALTIFAFVLRSKGEQVYFGDTAYLTVLTSSMQEKNENNPYLKDNDDGVRIHQYALIGIDKVDPAVLKEGDIIAFKYEGDTIYVHRIISVREVDGKRVFTTMGDANDISSFNEINISADRIVGVFNGYHNGYLGVLLIYMRSDIGMVALIFVFLLLAVINAAEWLITRSYEKRQLLLAAEMDSPKFTEEPLPEPVEEQEPVVDEGQPEPVEEQEPVVDEGQPEPVEEQEPVVDEEQPEPVKEQEPVVDEGQPEPVEEQEPVVDEEQPEPVEEHEPVVDEEELGEDDATEELLATEEELDEDSLAEELFNSLDKGGFDESILYKDAEEFTVAVSEENAVTQRVVYYRSFKARLIRSDDTVKAFYGKLKNELLRYKKLRSVISWRHEAFMFSNKGTAVKLLFRGKTLCVLLPYGEEEYVQAGIKLKSSGSGKKCILRIKGNITLGRAFKAIAYTMNKLGAVVGEEKNINYYMPYRSDEELVNENLIKIKTITVRPADRFKKFEDSGNG